MPLPVIQANTGQIKPSRAAPWRAGVLIAIHLLIAAHFAHWLTTGRTVTPVEPSEAMAFTKAGVINAGLIFFAATILLTAIFGRFFCGWACHLVALQDLARSWLERLGIRPLPLRSRVLLWVPAIACFYMFFWPLVFRLWIGDSFARGEVELTTTEFWATFPGWVVGGLTFLICGFVIIYFLGAKGFCTYACPYGALFGAADRLAPMRIRVTNACEGCGHCTAVCTSNVRVHEEVRDYGMVIDPGCMKCQDCVSVCPKEALYYGAGPIALLAKPRHEQDHGTSEKRGKRALSWRQELTLGLGFVAAFFTFRGLYGYVPFLMSLGVAAVLAFLVLLCARLVTEPNVAHKRFPFKRGGKLLPAGWVFVIWMTVLALFWLHSAGVRYHAYVGDHHYQQTFDWRRQAFAVGETRRSEPPSGEQRAHQQAAVHHLETAYRWGLLPALGQAGKLARAHFLGEDAGAAQRYAALSIERDEEPGAMFELLGLTALAAGDIEGAAGFFGRAIDANPASSSHYVALGYTLATGGELRGAQRVFEDGLERALRPSADLMYNAALVYAIQGEGASARGWFERALALDSRHLAARENLAGLLASLGHYDDSVVHYRLALDQASEDIQTRLLLARALAASGLTEEARAELNEILRRDPQHQGASGLLRELR